MVVRRFLGQPRRMKILRGPFRGARVLCRIRNSKRKLMGWYEHVLNDWIATVTPSKQFVLDIGANTGYDTYGFAHLLKKSTFASTCVIAFEPSADELPELTTPLAWTEYESSDVRIIKKFVGAADGADSICIDSAIAEQRMTGPGLVKLDIEGAEVEALRGATKLLDDPQVDWLIEIHGDHLICDVAKFFVSRSRPFLIKELTRIPIVGIEKRPINTYWLVTL